MLGVEAGELGSGGSSGGGYPFATRTSEAHMRQMLCWHGRTTGCLTISLHTGQFSSCSRLLMLDCWGQKGNKQTFDVKLKPSQGGGLDRAVQTGDSPPFRLIMDKDQT